MGFGARRGGQPAALGGFGSDLVPLEPPGLCDRAAAVAELRGTKEMRCVVD